DRTIQTDNIASKFGTTISHFLLYQFIGFGSFVLVFMGLLTGIRLFFGSPWKRPLWIWSWTIASSLLVSLLMSFIIPQHPMLSGMVGVEMSRLTIDYIGDIGLASILIFGCITFMVVILKITPESIRYVFSSFKTELKENQEERTAAQPFDLPVEETVKPVAKPSKQTKKDSSESDELKLTIDQPFEEEPEANLAKKLVQEQGEVDPTLELSKYRYPTLELLKAYNEEGITINEAELEENKEKIVETLNNYNISIADIKATIGPTVTLYEIVPAAGIRISKIKNLEDDIALSLSALGIRIIAPIPGKGSIGIEVPNKKPTIVSFRSVVSSKRFQEAEMELPLALGKTISNETFVVDLAKMPHMLMAGATGQGKSVGLNTILSSLLYKKHPAEIKFVLVDPKKVELTLYNKIERHYLAKLPDVEDAIITDNRQVINTLNSLCIEMDNRYNMLKNAMCRNIKEYNKRFKKRELNPKDGHAYLPYLVLIVDEFADLIMTAGKEVEAPIARLAQLARAVGIHLIIATQRPSVNVITGVIKANFPARVEFRVTSRIDSRTILD
ncbi:MAG: DNA translocase FtsK 4TM domain-containing protein, partial [Bacteroidota bacterium]|nr:DNA translocase FtsK 4TM domain-containing protein [Bacteroidota bacterium]